MGRFAFSTLACPSWTLEEIVRKANEYGFSGVELRGVLDQVDITLRPEFSSTHLGSTRRLFEEAGLSVCCLGSSVHLIGHESASEKEADRAQFERFLEVSVALGGVPIRVFGGQRPEGMSENDAAKAAAEELDWLASRARDGSVYVLVESHDAFLLGRQLGPMLACCSAPNTGVVWDVFNSQIPRHETLSETYGALRSYVRHVHVKDGVFHNGNYEYTSFGEGEIPYGEVFAWLKRDGYEGWFSVEWEKRWHPELANPEVMLPQYALAMSRLWDSL